jgi:hypothetical protein
VTGTDANWKQYVSGTEDQFGALLTTGFGSMGQRRSLSQNNLAASGTLWITYFRAPISYTVANLKAYSGTTAAGATPTLARLGLYSVATNGNLTLLSGTTNDTTLFSATNTGYTRALGASQAVTYGQWYATAVLLVTAAALPTLFGTTSGSNGLAAATAPRLSGSLGGQSDLPASITAGSVAAAAFCMWFELT